MVAVLEEKGSHKMARRVCEPRNRRGRGGGRGRVAETEVEVAKTEVEEAAAVKVATKVELGIRAPYGSARAGFTEREGKSLQSVGRRRDAL